MSSGGYMRRVVDNGMVQQILPGPRHSQVMYTGELSAASGQVTNTITIESGPAYAYVNRSPGVLASSFLPAAPCKCGARNPDNRCVSGLEETMPFEAKTEASSQYLESLWNAQPYMLVTPTDKSTMLREAPLKMPPLPSGPLGVPS